MVSTELPESSGNLQMAESHVFGLSPFNSLPVVSLPGSCLYYSKVGRTNGEGGSFFLRRMKAGMDTGFESRALRPGSSFLRRQRFWKR